MLKSAAILRGMLLNYSTVLAKLLPDLYRSTFFGEQKACRVDPQSDSRFFVYKMRKATALFLFLKNVQLEYNKDVHNLL